MEKIVLFATVHRGTWEQIVEVSTGRRLKISALPVLLVHDNVYFSLLIINSLGKLS